MHEYLQASVHLPGPQAVLSAACIWVLVGSFFPEMSPNVLQCLSAIISLVNFDFLCSGLHESHMCHVHTCSIAVGLPAH